MALAAKGQDMKKATVSDDLEETFKQPKEFTLIEEVIKKPQR